MENLEAIKTEAKIEVLEEMLEQIDEFGFFKFGEVMEEIYDTLDNLKKENKRLRKEDRGIQFSYLIFYFQFMENLEDYNHEKEEKRETYMQLHWKQLRKAGLEIEEYDTTYDLIDDELMDIEEVMEAIKVIKKEGEITI